MPNLTRTIERTDWPGIGGGEPNDRGFTHNLRLVMKWYGDIGENFHLELMLPHGESWIVRWIEWTWTLVFGTCENPGFATVGVYRTIDEWHEWDWGPDGGANPPTSRGWAPVTHSADLTLYESAVLADTIAKRILGDPLHEKRAPADLAEHVFDPETQLSLHWDGLEDVEACAYNSLALDLEVVRIPLAKPRRWTQADAIKGLTDIAALARRID